MKRQLTIDSSPLIIWSNFTRLFDEFEAVMRHKKWHIASHSYESKLIFYGPKQQNSLELFNDENVNNLVSRDILDENNLELKFLAMKPLDFILYLYISMVCNLFYIDPREYEVDYSVICDKLNIPDVLRSRMILIHRSFEDERANYVINNRIRSLPWNTYILSRLASDEKATYSEVSGKINISDVEIKSLRRICLLDGINIVDLVEIIHAYSGTKITPLLEKLQNIDEETFVEKSRIMSPCVNGTACVGKTTILNEALDRVRRKIDKDASILKSGIYGAFEGKDNSQLKAMLLQLNMICMSLEHYTSIMDRCPMNNMMWRIILSLMNERADLVGEVVRQFNTLTIEQIKNYSKFPIIIIVESDVLANRSRMRRRDEGTDYMRSKIENYVKAQNIVYGLFAYLCKWPLINRSSSSFEPETLIRLIYKKIESNVSRMNGLLPNQPPEPYKVHCEMFDDDNINYTYAKNLKIFK